MAAAIDFQSNGRKLSALVFQSHDDKEASVGGVDLCQVRIDLSLPSESHLGDCKEIAIAGLQQMIEAIQAA